MSHGAIAAVIPAAGASRRLGRPKQLLVRHARPLVRLAAERAAAAGCSPVIVVVGAHREAVTEALAGAAVDVVHHAGWEQGMGGSIAAGVRRLRRIGGDPAGVLLLPCDLPSVDVAELGELLLVFERSGGRPVAAAYEGVVGIPAVFPAADLAELERLEGDRGARGLLRGRADVVALPMAAAAHDVDESGDVADEDSGPA